MNGHSFSLMTLVFRHRSRQGFFFSHPKIIDIFSTISEQQHRKKNSLVKLPSNQYFSAHAQPVSASSCTEAFAFPLFIYIMKSSTYGDFCGDFELCISKYIA